MDQTKVEGAGGADTAKLVVAIALVIGGVAAYYLLGEQAAWMRWAAVAAGLALGLVVFAVSQRGQDFWQFVLDSRIELRKIVWPTREETGQTTLIVFVFVIVLGLFFWVLDLILAWATRALTGQGG